MLQKTDTTGSQAPNAAFAAPVQSRRDVEWRDLTLKQQRVLQWLAKFLMGKELTITRIYWRIGIALGMSQRAARVHVDALKQKGLILTEVACRPDFKQKIGVRISITPDAPIKHLPHKLSEAEIQEMRERGRINEQVSALMKQGYTFIEKLNGYVREPQGQNRF